jgi:hypothetical protein
VPWPHASSPPETPQLPLDDVIVKLDADPLRVIVPGVWTDQVPKESKPPRVLPEEEIALIVAFAGILPAGYDTCNKKPVRYLKESFTLTLVGDD